MHAPTNPHYNPYPQYYSPHSSPYYEHDAARVLQTSKDLRRIRDINGLSVFEMCLQRFTKTTVKVEKHHARSSPDTDYGRPQTEYYWLVTIIDNQHGKSNTEMRECFYFVRMLLRCPPVKSYSRSHQTSTLELPEQVYSLLFDDTAEAVTFKCALYDCTNCYFYASQDNDDNEAQQKNNNVQIVSSLSVEQGGVEKISLAVELMNNLQNKKIVRFCREFVIYLTNPVVCSNWMKETYTVIIPRVADRGCIVSIHGKTDDVVKAAQTIENAKQDLTDHIRTFTPNKQNFEDSNVASSSNSNIKNTTPQQFFDDSVLNLKDFLEGLSTNTKYRKKTIDTDIDPKDKCTRYDITDFSDITTYGDDIKLRPIVIDGANVMRCRNPAVVNYDDLYAAVSFFHKLGCNLVKAVVPHAYFIGKPRNLDAIGRDSFKKLEGGTLMLMPKASKHKALGHPHDDNAVIKIAMELDGCIISKDRFRAETKDLQDKDQYKNIVPFLQTRRIAFSFEGDRFMIHDENGMLDKFDLPIFQRLEKEVDE